jgi:hypothetical protein
MTHGYSEPDRTAGSVAIFVIRWSMVLRGRMKALHCSMYGTQVHRCTYWSTIMIGPTGCRLLHDAGPHGRWVAAVRV